MRTITIPDNTKKNISKVLARRKKTVKRLIAVLLFTLITYIFGFGDYGIYRYYQLRNEEKRLQAELLQLKSEATRLEKEKQLLEKQDPEYLQRIAREKFGLVKPGEKIYKLIPNTKNH